MTLLLHLDTNLAQLSVTTPQQNNLASLGPELDKLRDEICDIDEKMLAGEIPTPLSKQPLESGFVRQPERLLADYEANRPASQLGRMLAATKQLMTEVDRVVVLGDAQCLSGPRALMQACCQPHFNELSRGSRGSRPRMLFVGDCLDNDSVQGLLHLLGAHRGRAAASLDERWGLVVISRGIKTSSAKWLLKPLLDALHTNCGGDLQQLQSRVMWVLGDTCPFQAEANRLECASRFVFPAGVHESFSVLSLAGLVPAALLGINIMKLLEGGRAISEHFRTTKAADNLVLQFAGVNRLVDHTPIVPLRMWCNWCRALDGMSSWYRQLLCGCLGTELVDLDLLNNASPPAKLLSAPGTKATMPLVNQMVVHNFRFDPLSLISDISIDKPTLDFAHRNNLADVLHATRQQQQIALQSAGWPSVELSLAQVDEPSLGQLLQLLMLATVVEARRLGCNPYNS